MILKSLLPLVTKRHVERRMVPGVSAERLFEVVLDVDAYQTFLPYCRSSHILRKDKRLAPNAFMATLTVGIPPVLVETYTSHVVFHRPDNSKASSAPNTHDPPAFTVTTRSVESQYLESLWSRWKLQDVNVPSSSRSNHVGTHSALQSSTATSTTPSPNGSDVSSSAAAGGVDNNAAPDSSSLGCRVEFEVEMQVRDPIIAAALDQLLPKVAIQQVDAFVARSQMKTTKAANASRPS